MWTKWICSKINDAYVFLSNLIKKMNNYGGLCTFFLVVLLCGNIVHDMVVSVVVTRGKYFSDQY